METLCVHFHVSRRSESCDQLTSKKHGVLCSTEEKTDGYIFTNNQREKYNNQIFTANKWKQTQFL